MSLENNLLNKINNFKKNILQIIPTAGENTPSADSSGGSKGNSTNYARSDHQHPLSSAYATASHNHNLTDVNNTATITATITYTDDSTETVKLVKYTGN